MRERKNPITPEYVQQLEERLSVALMLLDAFIEEEATFLDEEDEELVEDLFQWAEKHLAHLDEEAESLDTQKESE